MGNGNFQGGGHANWPGVNPNGDVAPIANNWNPSVAAVENVLRGGALGGGTNNNMDMTVGPYGLTNAAIHNLAVLIVTAVASDRYETALYS